MKAARPALALLVLASLAVTSGCLCAPHSRMAAVQAANRTLAEQSRAQLAEIENLRSHARDIEDQLMRTEEELVMLEQQSGVDRRQLSSLRQERSEYHKQFRGLMAGSARVPSGVSRRLAEISKKYPSLHFDPVTGISKLDTDVLFDVGKAELKPGADKMLNELVAVLNQPEAANLKIMVVGHTDGRLIVRRPARDKYPNNFHLSSARALLVADLMGQLGLAEERLGVAGYGRCQPIAPNASEEDRQKNRRVEIFVMAPEVPVVGWTDSIPTVY